jgi:hypothetical protein
LRKKPKEIRTKQKKKKEEENKTENKEQEKAQKGPKKTKNSKIHNFIKYWKCT